MGGKKKKEKKGEKERGKRDRKGEQGKKKQQEKQERREKMETYIQLTKSLHPVTISPTKVEELKRQIERLEHHGRHSKVIKKNYDLAILNNRSHKELPGITSLDKEGSKMPRGHKPEVKYISKSKIRRELITKHKHGELNKSVINAKKVKYIPELRRNHKSKESLSMKKYDWVHDIEDKSLSSIEKYNRIIEKANMIEEQAKMKEMILRARGGTDKDFGMGESVTDMFLNAIRAKLAVLDSIQ